MSAPTELLPCGHPVADADPECPKCALDPRVMAERARDRLEYLRGDYTESVSPEERRWR